MDHRLQNFRLRYGLNPQQAFAELRSGKTSPLAVLSGAPSYINLLDALRGWKLVKELRRRFARPAAASFKHVNPAGAALGGGNLDEVFRRAHFLPDWTLSPLAIAYVRARQADRIASYGDFIALERQHRPRNGAGDQERGIGRGNRARPATRRRCRSCAASATVASSC